MYISDDIRYVGVNDHDIDLFESQYHVPDGMAYNSYVILGEKTAVMDTVEARFTVEWLKNLDKVLGGKAPDYLVIQHMEPDHSGSIADFAEKYPDVKIVASAKAFTMMKQFFGTDYIERQIIAEPGKTLDLGNHSLSFIPAPMVHWPEVIVSYDATDKVLFSADGFGKFGALDKDSEWSDEARRYYFGIVGKYGAQVQALLKKAAALDIQTICALHGPVLKGEALKDALRLYDIWSSYEAENDGVYIAYASIYGHTKVAAEKLAELLKAQGCSNVVVADLARSDMSKCIENAFRYKKLVLASSTYNMDVFPFMRSFIEHLTARGYQNRTVAFIENGSWAPNAANVMKKLLDGSKNLTLVEPTVTVKGSLNDESEKLLATLAKELSC